MESLSAVDNADLQARACLPRLSMAAISDYSIVTYERKPGHWRAAITRKARTGNVVDGAKVLSTVTSDDYASESDAHLAAQNLIRKL
jgi:hypothetical protein